MENPRRVENKSKQLKRKKATVKKNLKQTDRWSNVVISKFLKEYKQFPCLWDLNSDDYKKRDLKDTAFDNLLGVLRNSDPAFIEITLEALKNKIKILRGTYKQELDKVDASKKSGAGVEEVYEPHLVWYEDADCFLRESVATRRRKNNMDLFESEDEDVDEPQEIVMHGNSEPVLSSSQSSTGKKSKQNEKAEVNSEPPSSSRSSSVSRSSTGKKSKRNEAAELPALDVDAAISRLENLNKEVNEEDDNCKFGQFVTAQLKKLSTVAVLEMQQLITKLLNERRIQELQEQQQGHIVIYNYNGGGVDVIDD